MGRITETHDKVFDATMVTVYVAEETTMLRTQESEVNLALIGLRLRKYIELTVRLHTAGEV